MNNNEVKECNYKCGDFLDDNLVLFCLKLQQGCLEDLGQECYIKELQLQLLQLQEANGILACKVEKLSIELGELIEQNEQLKKDMKEIIRLIEKGFDCEQTKIVEASFNCWNKALNIAKQALKELEK